jgi:hypothetical protein
VCVDSFLGADGGCVRMLGMLDNFFGALLGIGCDGFGMRQERARQIWDEMPPFSDNGEKCVRPDC